MTADELYAKGYTLRFAAWGVSVYRTIDGSPEPSDEAVECVKQVHFERPLREDEAVVRGWEAATADYVMRRLTGGA